MGHCVPRGCGQTFPSLALNNNQANFTVGVTLHDSDGPRCGVTTWYTPYAGSQPQPISIDLYTTQAGGHPCDPISDSLAHEIGHVLGLGDAPNPGTTCLGSIMGGRYDGGTRTISSSDCNTADQDWTTPAETPPQQPPPNPDPGPGGCVSNCDPFNTTGAGTDPLVISLNGEYKFSGLGDPVSFDINAVGRKKTIGWTARGSEVGFLALDRNGNGLIDDGSELFGNGTSLRSGEKAENGFAALAQYDANGDGVIDASDPVWGRLLLWIDSNHNGISEPGELRHITDTSITAIELDYHAIARRDQFGNHFSYECRLREGRNSRSFYDVSFVTPR
jgi:hypothetical protein